MISRKCSANLKAFPTFSLSLCVLSVLRGKIKTSRHRRDSRSLQKFPASARRKPPNIRLRASHVSSRFIHRQKTRIP